MAQEDGQRTLSLVDGSSGPEAWAFEPGQRIADRYTIVRFIAGGGMGEIYEAMDDRLEERVALKTLRPDLAASETLKLSFLREIALARRVTHPNVCRTFDLGCHGDVIFLTMEFLAGETLAEWLLRRQRLTPREALPILVEIAAALDAAHRAGVVHGDLKPGNIMLVGKRVVVTDFGLAIAPGVHEPGDRRGGLRGTPAYMAPEQVRGEPTQIASDVYSFGLLAYRMVTGALPFNADTPARTARLRLEVDPPPPRTFAPKLDLRWQAAILRCLRRDPGERFRRAGDLVRALGRSSRVRLVIAAGLLVAGAVAAGLGLEGGPSPSRLDAVMPRDPVAARAFRQAGAELRALQAAAAIELLDQVAIPREPDFALAHAALAEAYWGLGREEEARAAARRALDRVAQRGDEERLFVEAIYWETAAEPTKAAEIWGRLAQRYPDATEYRFRRIASTWRDRDLVTARRLLGELRRDPRTARDSRVDVLELRLASAAGVPAEVPAVAARLIAVGYTGGRLPLVVEGLSALGVASWTTGYFGEALGVMREAQRLARLVHDEARASSLERQIAHVLVESGRIAEAEQIFLRVGEGQAARNPISNRLHGLGECALARGDLVTAVRRFEAELEASSRAEGRGAHRARAQYGLATALIPLGELDRARPLVDDYLGFARERGWRGAVAYALAARAELEVAAGNLVTARLDLVEAMAYWRSRGAALDVARGELQLAELALDEARFDEALADARDAGAIFTRLHLGDDATLAGAVAAEALAATGREEEARAARPPHVASERLVVHLRVELARARVARDPARTQALVEQARAAGLVVFARRAASPLR